MPTVTMELEGRQEIQGDEWKTGDVVADDQRDDEQSATHARESRSQASNRWVREGIRAEVDRRRDEVRAECLASGMRRHEAVERSWQVVLAEYPPPGAEPSPLEPTQPPPSDPLVPSGLGALPEHWPKLPANATLTAEIAWVLSSRLDVVTETPAGSIVDLSRAECPPPSKAALAWLETAITFPAKFADVAVKATQHAEDDQATTRRERSAVEEVSSLLDAMADDMSS